MILVNFVDKTILELQIIYEYISKPLEQYYPLRKNSNFGNTGYC